MKGGTEPQVRTALNPQVLGSNPRGRTKANRLVTGRFAASIAAGVTAAVPLRSHFTVPAEAARRASRVDTDDGICFCLYPSPSCRRRTRFLRSSASGFGDHPFATARSVG